LHLLKIYATLIVDGWWFYQREVAMNSAITPLRVPSLKEACVQRLEELILSGELKAGEKLASERELALQLGISRPVLHEALVDLAAKGLVAIEPRRGVYINDFRTNGSVAIPLTRLPATRAGWIRSGAKPDGHAPAGLKRDPYAWQLFTAPKNTCAGSRSFSL
jgi:DNA-binding transcriptional MocR family regulator